MLASVVRRADFVALRSHGTRVRTANLRARFDPGAPTGEDTLRVAFAIGRSFGPAVERNRARRRLRHALSEAKGRLDETATPAVVGDLLVSCSPRVLDLAYHSLVDECGALLVRAGRRLVSDAE